MRSPVNEAPPDAFERAHAESSQLESRDSVAGDTHSETMVRAASRAPASPGDLLNPLNVIVGFSSMLADLGNDLTPESRHRYAVRVREAADALQRAISSMGRADGRRAEVGEDWQSSGTFRVAPASAEERDADLSGPPSFAPGPGARPQVFVVDSDEGGRELVAEYLRGRGYDVVLFPSGAEALSRAEQHAPDLVLLEPLLPGEDGYYIAKMLKACNPQAFIPVVFVTSVVDDDARMRALDAGAEQIIKKPVNRHELRARVKGLLQLRAQQVELAAQNTQLKSLQRFKDETTAMLVHDLKSPLSAMMMNLDFALDDLRPESDNLDVRTALAESRAAGAKLFRMIANLLDIARSDDGRLVPKRTPVDVPTLFQRVILDHSAEGQARKVKLTSEVSIVDALSVDADILGRVLANLVENALRYTYAGGSIALAAHALPDGDSVELTVTNDGRPILPEWRAFVFEKYAQVVPTPSVNRGLGLYFCRVAVEAHGGRIELADEPATATCFRIVLPITPPAARDVAI